MKILFHDTEPVRKLAKQLVDEVRTWGDNIRLNDAQIIVARVFGYEDYRDFHNNVGSGTPSVPDAYAPKGEQAERFRQYVEILKENDFTREEATNLLLEVRTGPWWGFEQVDLDVETTARSTSAAKVVFHDKQSISVFYTSFKKAIKASGITFRLGRRKLMARLFGYETVASFYAAAGRDTPSPTDWTLHPDEMLQRKDQYLSVLIEAGITENEAIGLLNMAGGDGWWEFARLERAGVFVEKKAELPKRPILHLKPKPDPKAEQEAVQQKEKTFVVIADDGNLDLVICASKGYEHENVGYSEEMFPQFMKSFGTEIVRQIASIHADVREISGISVAFAIVQNDGQNQIENLIFLLPRRHVPVGTYENYLETGRRNVLRGRKSPTPTSIFSSEESGVSA